MAGAISNFAVSLCAIRKNQTMECKDRGTFKPCSGGLGSLVNQEIITTFGKIKLQRMLDSNGMINYI